MSGAEVLWDLDERGSASDQAFAQAVLGTTLAADASSTTQMNNIKILSEIKPLNFKIKTNRAYPIE